MGQVGPSGAGHELHDESSMKLSAIAVGVTASLLLIAFACMELHRRSVSPTIVLLVAALGVPPFYVGIVAYSRFLAELKEWQTHPGVRASMSLMLATLFWVLLFAVFVRSTPIGQDTGLVMMAGFYALMLGLAYLAFGISTRIDPRTAVRVIKVKLLLLLLLSFVPRTAKALGGGLHRLDRWVASCINSPTPLTPHHFGTVAEVNAAVFFDEDDQPLAHYAETAEDGILVYFRRDSVPKQDPQGHSLHPVTVDVIDRIRQQVREVERRRSEDEKRAGEERARQKKAEDDRRGQEEIDRVARARREQADAIAAAAKRTADAEAQRAAAVLEEGAERARRAREAREAEARRPPARVPVKSSAELDSLTLFEQDGRARVYYARSSDGTIELFDRSGIHPQLRLALEPVTPAIVGELRKQLTPPAPPPAPVDLLEKLERIDGFYRGTGHELAAIGPRLAGERIVLLGRVTSMSPPVEGDKGFTDVITLDGGMKLRVPWKGSAKDVREYFQLAKRRSGNQVGLKGQVLSNENGLCILQATELQER